MESDRRRHPRFKSNVFLGVPVILAPLPPYFGEPLRGQLLDLSGGGMAIYVGELIPNDTDLHLDLTFPDRSILSCNVRICRAIRQKERYVLGIEFLDLADFQQKKIDHMADDFLACEERIKAKAKNICKLECNFFTLCDKLEKSLFTRELDVTLEIRFRATNN